MKTTPSSASSVPIPTIPWNAKRTTLIKLCDGWFWAGTASSPVTVALGWWKASSDSSLGILIPYRTPEPSYQPSRCSGAPLVVVGSPSITASLIGCCAATAQPAPGVGARDDEAGDHEAAQVHVDQLVPEERVAKQRRERMDVHHPATPQRKADGMVHPTVHGDDEQRARKARNHHRNARQQVRTRREPIPAVDVDGNEDRLDEEREALGRKSDPEDITEGGHERRPQQAHLERQHRAGHHP